MLDSDWEQLVEEGLEELEEEEGLTEAAIQANAVALINNRSKKNLTQVKKLPYVTKHPNRFAFDQSARCVNLSCLASGDRFIDCPHNGNTVCQDCGTVQSTLIIQELCPFFWNYCGSSGNSNFHTDSIYSLISTYQARFHWNETEKLRSLTGPTVPEFNRRVIFNKLREMGYTKSSVFANPKLVIQDVCRRIDRELKVPLYGRKWGEHWMFLIARFSGYRYRPPAQTAEDRQLFAEKFDWFCKGWQFCSHMLPGSRKYSERSQLPQFLWIFRQFLLTFTPHLFHEWLIWLPMLSKGKERELDLFWRKMCFVNGWQYIPTDSFLRAIRTHQRPRRRPRQIPAKNRLSVYSDHVTVTPSSI